MVKTLKGVVQTLGLRRPIQWLISARYRSEQRMAGDLVRQAHQAGFDSVVRTHRGLGPSSAAYKYLDLEWHFEKCVREARKLELLGTRPLRILDLGCGTGAFLYVLKNEGHDVIGLDVEVDAVYDDMVELLGIPRVVHRIEPFQQLPNTIGQFDLITAFSICFNSQTNSSVWGPEEWLFFIDDCRRLLTERGRLYLNFNPATKRDFEFVPDDVAEMLRCVPGGTLSKSKEDFEMSLIR